MSLTSTLFNGDAEVCVPADSRGLAFGDGLFETVLVRRGQPHWLEEHLERMHRGCRQLNLDFPRDALGEDIESLLKDVEAERAVLKILLWRKNRQQRGYLPVTSAVDRLVSVQGLPPAMREEWDHGIRVELSPVRLSIEPHLAGLKHLNRLEQVMAGSRLMPGKREALLQDHSGHLIEAIAANVFFVIDGQLWTPSLQECGVAGIVRDKIVYYWQEQRHQQVKIGPIALSTLYAAQEVFICNSLNGILPVIAIGCHRKEAGPVTRQIQQYFEPIWHD